MRRLLAAATLVLPAACGGPLPEEWPPGMFCGVGDDLKDPTGTTGAPLLDAPGEWTGAIVNGVADPDPTVADLSARQQAAVGALVGGGGGNFCTGTLIGDNAVLTAAHCVDGRIAADMRFALGPDAARPAYAFDFAAVHSNPLWEGSADHDQAVCLLDGLASELYPDVVPIDINAEPLERLDPAFLGRRVQNVGYGSTEPGGGGFNTLRWWTVERISDVGRAQYETDGLGESAVCFGDSGSPGLLTFPDGVIRVVGTLNGGDPSCVDRDHWARTDADQAWILSFVVPAPGCRWGLRGRCTGDVAEWCVGEQEGDERTEDCAAAGRVCGADRDGNFRCLAGERCPDDLTYQGRCEDDVAVWCEDGLVRRRFCAPCGQVCGWVDNLWGFYCT